MNRIYIRDLELDCIIGTEPRERIEKQGVCINITLDCDFRDACESDKLEETVDYKALKDEVADFVRGSDCLLLEKLAWDIGTICKRRERVRGVRVCIDKPGALTSVHSVAVEVEL